MSVPTRVHHGLAFSASWTEYMRGCIPWQKETGKKERILFQKFSGKINLCTVESTKHSES